MSGFQNHGIQRGDCICVLSFNEVSYVLQSSIVEADNEHRSTLRLSTLVSLDRELLSLEQTQVTQHENWPIILKSQMPAYFSRS